MGFDPAQFMQPAYDPAQWATLNQRTRDGTAQVIQHGIDAKRQQEQFDVTSDQDQQRINEAARSNRFGEDLNERQLGLQRDKFAYEQLQEEQKRLEQYGKDKRMLLDNAETAEDVNAGLRALNEQYGFIDVPGASPASIRPQQPDVMPPMGAADAGIDDSVDAEYGQALDSIGAEPTPIGKSANPEYSGESLRNAQAADLGPLSTSKDVPPITAPVPKTDDDYSKLEQELNKPPVDLAGNIKGQAEAEAAQRFIDTSDKIRSFKLTDPIVEAAALNMLADATGQPRVGPTMPVPHPMDPQPMAPPEAKIPPEILELIADAREDVDDVATGLVASEGKYHTVDSRTGRVISEGDAWEETRNHRVQGRLERARMVFADLPEGSRDRAMFESHAQGYAHAKTPEEAKQHLAILMQRLQDAAAERRAGIMAQRQDASSDRADSKFDYEKIDRVRNTIASIVTRKEKNVDYKSWANTQHEVDQAYEVLTHSPNPMQQADALKRLAKAAEGGRLSDQDMKFFMNGTWGQQLEEALNKATTGGFSADRLKQITTILAQRKKAGATRQAQLAEELHDDVMSDQTLIDYGLSEEDRQRYADALVAQEIPGIKLGKRGRKSSIAAGERSTSKSSSRSSARKLSAEEAKNLDLEPL